MIDKVIGSQQASLVDRRRFFRGDSRQIGLANLSFLPETGVFLGGCLGVAPGVGVSFEVDDRLGRSAGVAPGAVRPAGSGSVCDTSMLMGWKKD